MEDPMENTPMVQMSLGRIVIRDGADQQYIFLRENGGARGFPIVIGMGEACEIRRVVTGIQPERPLTHQLAYDAIQKLGHELQRVDIVDLRNNTFFARLVLQDSGGQIAAVIDARPSDAIALALRAQCPILVAEFVLERVRTDTSGPDPLPEGEADEPEKPDQG
jgi:bifunctional DNase/RNase